MVSWLILTGEYPPKLGGVGDYTRNLALALARSGDEVQVFTPSRGHELVVDPDVFVHVLPDHYGPRALLFLERALAKRPGARVLIQYVPQGFGAYGMNVPFYLWLAARRRPVWIMFHEVAVWFDRQAGWKVNALAFVTQKMAGIVAERAERIFISTTLWVDLLHDIAPGAREPIWLPIPSNLPEAVTHATALQARELLSLAPGDWVIGTFGSQAYGGQAGELLAGTLLRFLEGDSRRIALLMGKGSVEFVKRIVGERRRAIATGPIALEQAAAHLASCAAALQPCADGVSSRRTSVMAGLALGVPVITNPGRSSEPIWKADDVVALARESSSKALLEAAERLFEDDALRARIGERGRALYRRTFSLETITRKLRAEAE